MRVGLQRWGQAGELMVVEVLQHRPTLPACCRSFPYVPCISTDCSPSTAGCNKYAPGGSQDAVLGVCSTTYSTPDAASADPSETFTFVPQSRSNCSRPAELGRRSTGASAWGCLQPRIYVFPPPPPPLRPRNQFAAAPSTNPSPSPSPAPKPSPSPSPVPSSKKSPPPPSKGPSVRSSPPPLPLLPPPSSCDPHDSQCAYDSDCCSGHCIQNSSQNSYCHNCLKKGETCYYSVDCCR